MKKATFAAIAASALAAVTIVLTAPVQAAPTGPGNAEQAIAELEAKGFHVIVNRIGSAPLDEATVVAIREGQTYARTDSGVAGAGEDAVTTITGKTVYVDVR